MSTLTLNELVNLWGRDVNAEVPEKTVREMLEFALMATERQTTVLSLGTDRHSRKVRISGQDVGQGVIMVRLLGRELNPSVHRQTTKCLADLAVSPENQMKIAACPGVLDALVSQLGKAGGDGSHEHTVRCLANLAQTQENHMKMVSYSVLDSLVRLLAKDGLPPNVHQETARCLTNLAVSKENLERIGSYPDALDALVRLLGKSGCSGVHEQTVKCLTTLATLQSTQMRLVSGHSAVLDALVRLLGKIGTSSVQRQSLKCLTILSDHYQSNKEYITSYPGVLDALMRLLKLNWITTDKILVQVEAAKCLVNLSTVSAPENLVRIASHRDALTALVSCLESKRRIREMQNLAAECFNSLAGASENRRMIVKYPGAVSALVNQLKQDVNPRGQELAASCLSRLANAQETKIPLTSHPGLLDSLVKLLKKSSSETQEPTIRCLSFLAQSPSNENKVKIASHPNVINELVRVMRTSLDAVSLKQGAKCLSYLALAQENVQKIYPCFLVLLQEGNSSGVLEYTAKCLTNLASCSIENQVTIATFPGMIDALVSLLSPKVDLNPTVQEKIVRCLAQLSLALANQVNIGSYPGAQYALRNLVTEHVNSNVQEQAAVCLANLNRSAVAEERPRIHDMQRLVDSQNLSDPDRWCVDPITYDIMCDPVKCNDGITYDRWTIINNDIRRSPYDPGLKSFVIACDDIDVRKRLFREFPEQAAKFRMLRENYREKALQHAVALEFQDAIEMLNHVLQWSPSDIHCQNELDRIRNLQASSLNPQSQQRLLLPESSEGDSPIRVHDEAEPPPRSVEVEATPTIPEHLPQERISTIPLIQHEDLRRESAREGCQMTLIFVFLYVVILSSIT